MPTSSTKAKVSNDCYSLGLQTMHLSQIRVIVSRQLVCLLSPLSLGIHGGQATLRSLIPLTLSSYLAFN